MKEGFPSPLNRKMSRRGFLEFAAVAATAAIAPTILRERETPMETVHFSTSQLGVNINTKNIRWFHGKDKEREIVESLMDLPVDHVRIPLPFDEIMAHPDKPNFATTDWIIDMALQKGKRIHLQMGLKTINWPEFHLPQWFTEKFPEVVQPHVQIGTRPERDEIIEQYIEACSRRYLQGKTKNDIDSLQLENEAFSQNLSVTNRSVHPELQQKETAVVKRFAPDIPLLQNIPWDTFWKSPHVYSTSDIVGLNVYNQAGQHEWTQPFLWTALRGAKMWGRVKGKKIVIPEYQAGAWLGGNKEPDYPYTFEEFKNGLEHIHSIKPDITFLWAMELHVGKEKSDHVEYLNEITKAA